MHPTWKLWLSPFMETDTYKNLIRLIEDKRKEGVEIYPPQDLMFRAFEKDPLSLKIVILGQDPYHGPGQAMGLSFSVPEGQKLPPSLKNIYKEIQNDLNIDMSKRSGDLSHWEDQGVFLLNTLLSVERSKPLSHAKIGWEELTDLAIKKLSENHSGLVFMLWGANAHKVSNKIENKDKHLILTSAHPSPFSYHRGFKGCSHFSKANKWLLERGLKNIKW